MDEASEIRMLQAALKEADDEADCWFRTYRAERLHTLYLTRTLKPTLRSEHFWGGLVIGMCICVALALIGGALAGL